MCVATIPLGSFTQRESSLGRLLDNKSHTIHTGWYNRISVKSLFGQVSTIPACGDVTINHAKRKMRTSWHTTPIRHINSRRCRAKRVSPRLYPGGRLGDAPLCCESIGTNEPRQPRTIPIMSHQQRSQHREALRGALHDYKFALTRPKWAAQRRTHRQHT